MKKLQYLFVFLLCVIFFSCKQEEAKPIHLDVAKLKEMKAKWQGLNIKNYSFTYVFDVWKPRLHTGYVKVENGIGKVIFEIKKGMNRLTQMMNGKNVTILLQWTKFLTIS